MLKRKSGLQKEVSKIFTGIQIPRNNTSDANTLPTAPVPAKYIGPKPVSAASCPVIIPKPLQNTPSVPAPAPKVYEQQAPAPKVYEQQAPAPKVYEQQAPAPKVYEQQAPAPKVYEQPAPAHDVYEPPAPVSAAPRQFSQELPSKSPFKIPRLKIWEKLQSKLLASKSGVSQGRQKAMVLLIPVLFVVLIVVLTRVLKTPARPAAKTGNSAAASSIVFDGKIGWEMPPAYPEKIRDPMVFGAVAQSKENSDRPSVKGIVYSEDNPCAVIGDRIVSVGGVVNGAKIVKINPDSVEFSKGDETWTQKVER